MKRWFSMSFTLICSMIAGILLGPPVWAATDPIVDGCWRHQLPAADDTSSSRIALSSPIRLGTRTFDTAWVNNNGNITFDGPTIAYTPFGLSSTNRAIVAPFFADVDTTYTSRATWAQVTFEGRPALCANWLDVGYSSSGSDKRNSLQMLLVDRTDVARGAFDIVFNYRSIQWETGTYSGGENGYGGNSATVGFSNGSGKFFEMPGSRSPGSFLDGRYQSLVSRSNTGMPGRWLWRIRDGMGPTNYVALGDSFQSGEGAYDYEPGTDQQGNECHRSRNAYPHRLPQQTGSHHLGVPVTLRFVACSGARMAEMTNPNVRNSEPAQLDALGPDTALVTIGIGGNDLEFADALGKCVKSTVAAPLLNPLVWRMANCKRLLSGQVSDLTRSMTDGPLAQQLAEVYQQVRRRAPQAKVIVVTYPKFFKESRSRAPFFGGGGCNGVRGSDAIWLNEAVANADAVFSTHAVRNGFLVADVQNAFGDRHGLCSDEEAMNGIIAWDSWNNKKPGAGAYHPNSLGHHKMADVIRPLVSLALGVGSPSARAATSMTTDKYGAWPTETIPIEQGEVVTRTRKVTGEDFAVNVMWGDATITTRIQSPSGRWYSALDLHGAEHMTARGYEHFVVADPEPGTWSVEMTGVKTFPSDIPLTLATSQRLPDDRDPVVRTRVGVDETGAVTFDSTGSTDPEGGQIRTYWDFGDGAEATGTQASHTYAAGTYFPTVAVFDDADNATVEDVNVIVEQVVGKKPVLTFVTAGGRPTGVLDPNDPNARTPSRIARPTGLTVRRKGRRLLVRWKAVPGALGYTINTRTRYAGQAGTVPEVDASRAPSAVVHLDGKPAGYRVCVIAADVKTASAPACVVKRSRR